MAAHHAIDRYCTLLSRGGPAAAGLPTLIRSLLAARFFHASAGRLAAAADYLEARLVEGQEPAAQRLRTATALVHTETGLAASILMLIDQLPVPLGPVPSAVRDSGCLQQVARLQLALLRVTRSAVAHQARARQDVLDGIDAFHRILASACDVRRSHPEVLAALHPLFRGGPLFVLLCVVADVMARDRRRPRLRMPRALRGVASGLELSSAQGLMRASARGFAVCSLRRSGDHLRGVNQLQSARARAKHQPDCAAPRCALPCQAPPLASLFALSCSQMLAQSPQLLHGLGRRGPVWLALDVAEWALTEEGTMRRAEDIANGPSDSVGELRAYL
jgi:hypothetical protein